MSEVKTFSITMEQIKNYEFKVNFNLENVEDLLMDEPYPLGTGKGPNPSRIVAAGIGNCLSASLIFCLLKAKIEHKGINTRVDGTIVRNKNNRLRMGKVDVTITIDIDENQKERISRCLELFEDYCVVTQSIRDGIPVDVHIVDKNGNKLK